MVKQYDCAASALADGWDVERVPGTHRRWLWVPDNAKFRVFVEGREDFISDHAHVLPSALRQSTEAKQNDPA